VRGGGDDGRDEVGRLEVLVQLAAARPTASWRPGSGRGGAGIGYHALVRSVSRTVGPTVLRRHLAAAALSVVLFALVAYWASAGVEERRPPARRARRGRAPWPAAAPVVACETLAVGRWPYAARRRPPRRLVPFRPTRHPFERN
jgi:hypothetical protein